MIDNLLDSKKDMKPILPIRTFLNEVSEKIASAGGRAYFVGGYVRDNLLGLKNSDTDVEVYGITPNKLKRILAHYGPVSKYGKSFGIMSVDGYEVDFSMPRRERKIGLGHADFDIDIDSNMTVKEGQERRDLTINSMNQDILTGEIIDNFGAQADIKNKILRHVGDRFSEDPLRVLRLARFSARLPDFSISKDTLDLCKTIDISMLSRERIKTEVDKALLSSKPSNFFITLKETSHLKEFFPELEALIGLKGDLNKHAEDCFEHTMMVLDKCSEVKNLAKHPLSFMYAALCHDLGKKDAFNPETLSFIGHEELGVTVAESMLSRFTNEKELIRYVKDLTLYHMDFHNLFRNNSHDKKILACLDTTSFPDDLSLFCCCDGVARLGAAPISFKDYMTFRDKALNLYVNYKKTNRVTGNDLLRLGYREGSEFGNVLSRAKKLSYGNDRDTVLKIIQKEFPLQK